MNINTDLIKNKKFNEAISSELVKTSQEYRVLAVLRYLFPGEYEQMEHGDKPDLQDNINHFGIEVTSAVQADDMKVNRALAEFDETSSEKLAKDLDKIIKCGYDIHVTNGIMSISKGGGITDLEKNCLYNAIINKCKKSNDYREKYARIGLAVFLPEIPTSYAENQFIDWLKEMSSEIEQSFDFVFVISHRFCIRYDIKNDYTVKNDISKTENYMLSKIARMTAEGELTLDSIEWK